MPGSHDVTALLCAIPHAGFTCSSMQYGVRLFLVMPQAEPVPLTRARISSHHDSSMTHHDLTPPRCGPSSRTIQGRAATAPSLAWSRPGLSQFSKFQVGPQRSASPRQLWNDLLARNASVPELIHMACSYLEDGLRFSRTTPQACALFLSCIAGGLGLGRCFDVKRLIRWVDSGLGP